MCCTIEYGLDDGKRILRSFYGRNGNGFACVYASSAIHFHGLKWCQNGVSVSILPDKSFLDALIASVRSLPSPSRRPKKFLIPIGLTISTHVRRQGLRIPDLLGILINAPIAREEAHAAHAGDALLQPSILILESLVDQPVRLDIRREVVGHQVVIAVLGDAVAEGGEAAGVAEHPRFDGGEHLSEVRVELEGAVVVRVPEVLDVLG